MLLTLQPVIIPWEGRREGERERERKRKRNRKLNQIACPRIIQPDQKNMILRWEITIVYL